MKAEHDILKKKRQPVLPRTRYEARVHREVPGDLARISNLRSARYCLASGFHAWLIRAPSARARSNEEFGGKVRPSFIFSYWTYGARRVWHDLLAEGLSGGLHRVERLMLVHGLKARPRRRGPPKDDDLRSVIADNLIDRLFTAEAPNQR